MGVFDQASHYLVKRDRDAFFAWRVPRFVARFAFRDWADTTTVAFPGEPDRVCDTVAEFAPREGEGPRRLLDVEFQAEPHPDMLERLGEYTYRLRRELRHGPGGDRKYRVVSVLLNLTGAPQQAELDMREDDLDGAGAHLRVVQFTLRDEDAAATLARIASGDLSRRVLPWIPLMHGAGEAGMIEEWKRLALEEPDGRWRADYGGLALVFAELAGRLPVWKQALEGWSMKQSEQVLEWQAEARKEGEVDRLRAVVLRAMELRYRTAVPPDLAAVVRGMADLDELSRWFDATQTCDSLEAFRAAVGLPALPSVN